MKIIKKGKLPKAKEIFRGKCGKCNAEIECDEYDRWGDLIMPYFIIPCLTKRCGENIKVIKIK